MYERFTDRSRKVMQLANQEATLMNHEYIGTEHILLGIVKEGTGGIAAIALSHVGLTLAAVRQEVKKCLVEGPDMTPLSKLPQTPRTKRVIEYAIEEAKNRNHNYVGTDHLLLGLIREKEGVAHHVLSSLCDLDALRAAIDKIHHLPPEPAPDKDAEYVKQIAAVLLEGLLCERPKETMNKITKIVNDRTVGEIAKNKPREV